MAAATGSEIPIAPPPLVAPVTGLLNQVQVISGPGADEWIRGLAFVPEAQEGVTLDSLCSLAVFGSNDLLSRFGPIKVTPFETVLRDRCSTWGFEENDYVGRVTRALDVKRHQAVEREFESGTLEPTNLHLAENYTAPDPTTVTLGGGVRVSPVNALALLDEAIAASANNIGRGMIHATAFVIALWKAAGLLSSETIEGDEGLGARTQLYSPKGNVVIAGNGYEGRGPDGNVVAAHASQWAYATDWIVVVAGTPETVPATFEEAVDRSRNLVSYQQHQWFAILWAGLLHAAVLVATSTPVVA